MRTSKVKDNTAMATKTATLEISTNQTAKMESAIEEYFTRIDRALAESKQTQARIDKIKAETQVIRSRVRARLKSLCGRSF